LSAKLKKHTPSWRFCPLGYYT